MSSIDYSKYDITATSQFYDGLSQLRDKGHVAELKKLFRLIEEIVEEVDMYNNDKMTHLQRFAKCKPLFNFKK